MNYNRYRWLADAVLMLWIENILTDSEYDKLITKLNSLYIEHNTK